MEYLVKFTCEVIWSRTFVCWEFFDYCFNFTRCNLSIQILWSSWFSFERVYVFRNLSISCRFSNLLAYSVHNIFLTILCIFLCQLLYVLFNFWLYLGHKLIYLGPFSFCSWWVWLKVCQFHLSFQRTSYWIHWSFVSFF